MAGHWNESYNSHINTNRVGPSGNHRPTPRVFSLGQMNYSGYNQCNMALPTNTSYGPPRNYYGRFGNG